MMSVKVLAPSSQTKCIWNILAAKQKRNTYGNKTIYEIVKYDQGTVVFITKNIYHCPLYYFNLHPV